MARPVDLGQQLRNACPSTGAVEQPAHLVLGQQGRPGKGKKWRGEERFEELGRMEIPPQPCLGR